MEKIDDSICSDIEQDDDQAWTAFYAAFAPIMRAYAVRRGCDEPDDAVQDVFVKFVAAVRDGRFRARSAAETCSYLKTQVVRQVIDYHRRAKARCRDMTVEIDEIEIAVPAAVPQIVEAREEAAIRVRTRARVVSGWRCSERAERPRRRSVLERAVGIGVEVDADARRVVCRVFAPAMHVSAEGLDDKEDGRIAF